MGRPLRRVAVLVAVLVLAGSFRPAVAAPPAADVSTVLLSLTQRPGAAAELARLARTPLAPRTTGLAAARAAADRRTAVEALAPEARHQAAVLAFAHDHGLQVRRADGWTVTLAGPAQTLAGLFGTTLAGGRATSPLAVPASLRGDVRLVSGLDDRPFLRTRAVPVGYSGDQLRQQYAVPQPGWTGAGVTVGTLNLTGWDPNDLTTYAQAAGVPLAPGQVTSVPLDGADPLARDGSGGDFEVAMDAEAILATAPAARQRMYFAPNNGVGTVDVFNQMAQDGRNGLLQVASTSWGLCEADLAPYPWYTTQVGDAITLMLAAGVTLYAASGDSGIYDCSRSTSVDNTPSVDFPASHPGVVGVGGTSITALGGAETVWGSILASPGTSYAGSGGGGGRSVLFDRPSYQSGVGATETKRLVPDVASVADPRTGLGVAYQGRWYGGGGTSLGAPTWAGLTAAALSAAGRTTGLGDVHPALYANRAAFTDVVTGSNGYPATAGFDLATGLGTPVWALLGAALTGAPAVPVDTAAPTTTVSARLSPGTDTRVQLAWSGHDAAPSAGLGPYLVTVSQVGGGTVWSARTSATSQVLRLSAGRTYTLSVRSTDLAGHTGAASSARVGVPWDDASLARYGTWGRGWLSGDYLGSHVLSRTRGAAVAMTVTARTISMGFVKAPSAGYADVYVDGRRVARLDLYATSVLRRQQYRVFSGTTTARHTVKVVVVGAKRAAATSTWVMPDSLLALP